MRKGQAQAGFTLIELLIVVAIIAILATVLIPNILNARKRSYDAAAQAYARNLVATIAAADAGGNPITGAVNCLTGLTASATGDAGKLVAEGATNAPAQSVRACNVAVDTTTNRVTVTVTSQGNQTYTLLY